MFGAANDIHSVGDPCSCCRPLNHNLVHEQNQFAVVIAEPDDNPAALPDPDGASSGGATATFSKALITNACKQVTWLSLLWHVQT